MVLKYIHLGTVLVVNVVLSIWSVIAPVHRFNTVYFAVNILCECVLQIQEMSNRPEEGLWLLGHVPGRISILSLG